MVRNALDTVNKQCSFVKFTKGYQIINKPEGAEQERSFFTGEAVIANISVEKTVMAQFALGRFNC